MPNATTSGDQIELAGAVFRQCALQVNPGHYGATFQGQQVTGDVGAHARAVIEKAAEIGVSVLAITDHNSVSDVAAFRDAAAGHGITIFPGFELTSSEGIHVLCIYPSDTDDEKLSRFLGGFGIQEIEPSTDPSSKGFAEIIEEVQAKDGIAVAAHVTGDKGFFKELHGQPRIREWRNEQLLAIQIPGPVRDLPMDVRRIVENKDSNYQRAHAAGEHLSVAVINAKDIVQPDDLYDQSATCWIKMSEVTIEGLRQAFLDPDSRIRLNSDAKPEQHTELLGMSWEGGFLDGTFINLNPNLNVLIGGRGAGKSTVIESLRYVLDLEPIGEEAGKAHAGMVRQVLRSGTRVSLLVRTYRPAERKYLIERTVPNPPIVRDENGQISNLLPADILPRIEVYGQHEISELTRSGEKLTRLLDRFVQGDETLRQRKAGLLRDLKQTKAAIVNVNSEIDQVEERLATLPALEETLTRFQEAGLEGRLQERSLLVREERVLDSIPDRMRPFRECLDLFRQELPIDRTFLSERALAELPGKEILADANGVLEHLSLDLDRVMSLLETAISRADGRIGEIRSRWDEHKGEVEAAYQKILRDLQESAVDGAEFIRLRGEIESLRPLDEHRTLLERLSKEHKDRRRTLLAEWEDIKAIEFRNLDKAAGKVSRNLRDHVQVEVTAAGDRGPLFQLLRDEIGGRLSEVIETLDKVEELSLPELVAYWQQGPEALRRRYGFSSAQAKRLGEATDEVLMGVEELELPPTTAIRLNTAPVGEPPSWQALEALSTGQKATAVLLLLLLESDAPLIIDQPEDDLDNRFITEGVVPKMRAEKRRRQFIFSTHNANIPVLGDAELILGLTARGEAGDGRAHVAPEHTGSIDAQPVRELVENLLEGGRDAFETRRLKYGF